MIRRRLANRGKRTSARRRKRKANMRRCDAVFSKLVRSVGRCEAVEGWPHECAGPLQCAHVVSRTYRAVRWDRANALCLCSAAHVRFTHRPLEWERFITDLIGPDAYADLKRRALVVTRVDYEAVLTSLEAAPLPNPLPSIPEQEIERMDKTEAECHANAALIAAAPDLLALLIGLRDEWFEPHYGQNDVGMAALLRDKIRAAIQAAEGGQR